MADLKSLIKTANEISFLSSKILNYNRALNACSTSSNLNDYRARLMAEKLNFQVRLKNLLDETEVKLLKEEMKD